jgi:hypothetical protein
MPRSGFGSGWQDSDIMQVNDTCFLSDRTSSFTNDYSSIEKYLMGLIPLDSVDFPYRTLINWEFQGFQNGMRKFFADGIDTIDQAEFSSAMGPRVPDYTTAQKHFNAAMIVISDTLLSRKDLAYYHWLATINELPDFSPGLISHYDRNYQMATDSMGSITTRLPAPVLCKIVCTDSCYGEGSLRSAIECANEGDTIFFAPDVFNSTIPLCDSAIVVDKSIYLVAAYNNNIRISELDINNTEPLMLISGALKFSGIKIIGQTENSMILKVAAGGSVEFIDMELEKVRIDKE